MINVIKGNYAKANQEDEKKDEQNEPDKTPDQSS